MSMIDFFAWVLQMIGLGTLLCLTLCVIYVIRKRYERRQNNNRRAS